MEKVNGEQVRMSWNSQQHNDFRNTLIEFVKNNQHLIFKDNEYQSQHESQICNIEEINDHDLVELVEILKKYQKKLFSNASKLMNKRYNYKLTRKQLQTRYDLFKKVFYNEKFDDQTYEEIYYRLNEEFQKNRKFEENTAALVIDEFIKKKNIKMLHKYTAFAKIQYMMKKIEMKKAPQITDRDIQIMQQILQGLQSILQ